MTLLMDEEEAGASFASSTLAVGTAQPSQLDFAAATSLLGESGPCRRISLREEAEGKGEEQGCGRSSRQEEEEAGGGGGRKMAAGMRFTLSEL
eukprot:65398-Hanusia_phi.AAC.2